MLVVIIMRSINLAQRRWGTQRQGVAVARSRPPLASTWPSHPKQFAFACKLREESAACYEKIFIYLCNLFLCSCCVRTNRLSPPSSAAFLLSACLSASSLLLCPRGTKAQHAPSPAAPALMWADVVRVLLCVQANSCISSQRRAASGTIAQSVLWHVYCSGKAYFCIFARATTHARIIMITALGVLISTRGPRPGAHPARAQVPPVSGGPVAASTLVRRADTTAVIQHRDKCNISSRRRLM